MQRPVWQSLFAKLNALTIALVLGTAGATIAFVAVDVSERSTAALEARGRSLAALVAAESEFGLFADDAGAFAGILGGLAADPGVAWARVVRQDGRVLVEREYHGPRGADDIVVSATVTSGGGAVRGDFDPLAASEPRRTLGTIELGLSRATAVAVAEGAIEKVVVFALLMLVLGIAITVIMTFRITSPIRSLVAGASRVSRGDFTQPVAVTAKDELGELAAAFNRMADALALRASEIEAAHRELEAKVEERTSELKLASERARTMAHQAETANFAKSAFLANMSHELRTPLNAIIGFSELLVAGKVGPVTELQRGCLEDVVASGQHLLSLVQDVLDVAKIEAGRTEINSERLDLELLVKDSLRMISEKATTLGLELKTDLARAPAEVDGDARMLKQILTNLLTNAVKFTKTGGRVALIVDVVDQSTVSDIVPANFSDWSIAIQASTGPFVRFQLTDSGIGIAKEDQRRIFEPFQQADNGLARAFGGTGLGLAICRQFVELHGGMIWVESERDKGSTFAFIVPLRAPVVRGEVAASSRPRRSGSLELIAAGAQS